MGSGLNRFRDVEFPTPKLVCIPGCFQTNGTSNPDVLTGRGYSVAYVSTGKFTVTLERSLYPISVIPGVGETGANQDFTAHIEELDLTARTQTFIVHTRLGANDANTDNQQVHFVFWGSDSSIVPSRSS